MRLILVLCLGTFVLSAPAPQRIRQIDFLWQKSQDDETPASVQPVEQSTVEPKVTATKITDPRKSVPVREEEEEEADVQEEAREPSPTASPLNSDQEESVDELDDSENSERNEDASSERNQENEDQTEAVEEGTTERAIIDTTIRVYDEEEENDKNTEKEEEHTEHEQKQEQTEDQEPEQEQQQLSNQEDEKQGQGQQTDLWSDSYQYDDESFERQLQEDRTESQMTTTVPPESNPEITVTDAGFDIEVKGGTLVVDKDTFENLNREKPGFQNWHHHDFNGSFDFHGPHHHRGHSGDGHRGPPPHNHPGPHGDGPFGFAFHGPPFHGPQFDGPPPPWVHNHRFHHDHPHDLKIEFKGHGGSKGYPFQDNMFHRRDAFWPSWKTALSSEELPTKVNNLSEQ